MQDVASPGAKDKAKRERHRPRLSRPRHDRPPAAIAVVGRAGSLSWIVKHTVLHGSAPPHRSLLTVWCPKMKTRGERDESFLIGEYTTVGAGFPRLAGPLEDRAHWAGKPRPYRLGTGLGVLTHDATGRRTVNVDPGLQRCAR